MNQALSFALFRTYAVPSIGRLLFQTGEFTERTQKRYEDTALLLAEAVEHGPGSPQGRTAIRRVNAMHRAYDISDDDLRYVLCTFVAVPIRWMDAYGWRPFTDHEKTVNAEFYRQLGTMMAIRDIPATWQDFGKALDAYEREHFGHDPGARAVADATLQLMTTFPLNNWLPAALVKRSSYALMDDPLLDALGYPRPSRAVRAAVRGGLRLRGRAVRRLPPRERPLHVRDLPSMTMYRDGYDVEQLGTFPTGCPVPRQRDEVEPAP